MEGQRYEKPKMEKRKLDLREESEGLLQEERESSISDGSGVRVKRGDNHVGDRRFVEGRIFKKVREEKPTTAPRDRQD